MPALRLSSARLAVILGLAGPLVLPACSSSSSTQPRAPEQAAAGEPSEPLEPEARAAAPPEPDPCTEALEAVRQSFDGLAEEHGGCDFDHECVAVPVAVEGCYEGCPEAAHARGVTEVRAVDVGALACREGCGTILEADCDGSASATCLEGRCTMASEPALEAIEVPEGNRRGTTPPRPAPGDAEQERASRLFDAIVHDDPARALDFFFPKEAFHLVKAIEDPDGYWDRLFRRYEQDIHALHEQLVTTHGEDTLTSASFGRLDIIRRGGWVPVGDEGNALPYWVSRHSMLYYEAGGREHRFEVRVLITWGERWFITHLNEFR